MTPILEEQKTKHRPAATTAKYAALDAQERSRQAQALYDSTEQQIAALTHALASKVFSRSRVYLNFREQFVAIKVDAPQRADMITDEFNLLEQRVAKLGGSVVTTRRNRIYRILNR